VKFYNTNVDNSDENGGGIRRKGKYEGNSDTKKLRVIKNDASFELKSDEEQEIDKTGQRRSKKPGKEVRKASSKAGKLPNIFSNIQVKSAAVSNDLEAKNSAQTKEYLQKRELELGKT
jgi:hypothetical protein